MKFIFVFGGIMSASNQVICLMGPTCAGKTDLALQLHAILPVEIISVDSAMVYCGMDIGTAKPSQAMRQAIPHHLIDICDPAESYSAGRFCVEANALIQAVFRQQKIPLLVGGTMLYYRALQQGLAVLPTQDEAIRSALLTRMQQEGLASLYVMLQAVDPVAAARLNAHDPQRIVRALEVYQVTGKPISYWWQQPPALNTVPMMNIGLLPDREALPARIEARFHAMLQQGFLEEVAQLYARGDLHEALPAIKSVGYKQAWQYLAGQLHYDEMVARAIIATRQLAKRQFTWLRSWPNLQVVFAESPDVLNQVKKIINEHLVR